ncbi:MAG: thioredoxin family protein [Flavobacteriaceae bacterium]|nr:thioredoxin family protein [Flavobacteriaceae bacterium]
MKKILSLLLMIFALSMNNAQERAKRHIYNSEDNARQKIDSTVAVAQKENKFVFLQVGGNWCVWCLRFNKLTEENADIHKVLESNFIVYHLNYSKENKNEAVLKQLGFPQRFGFPVFVILNKKGERIHTQQSDFLEDGGTGYDEGKVKTFLEQWSPEALNPENYERK